VNIKDIRRRKKELNLTTAEIAYRAKLPVSTVSKVMTGETTRPRYITVEKINEVLAREEMLIRVRAYIDELLAYIKEHPDEDVDQIKFEKEYRRRNNLDKSSLPYSKPIDTAVVQPSGNLAILRTERVNIEQLLDLEQDRRLELIDGHLIVNEFPGMRHQLLVKNLGKVIDRYIDETGGECLMLNVGANVRLDEDDYNLVGPDIVVLCDSNKVEELGIIGAPDWIIEVVSPSSRGRDYKLKMCKYINAGVREYWIIDPEKEKVTTYIEGEPTMAYVYGFDDDIPVYIYEGKLKICIREMDEAGR
jgi:Uma2 family endonuclease